MQDNSSKIGRKFGKMTGRVEFFALSAEIEKMLQQGHSVRYVFDYFSVQNKFTQSYQTFLRYIHKHKNLHNIKQQKTNEYNNLNYKNISTNKTINTNMEIKSNQNKKRLLLDKYEWKEIIDKDGNIHIVAPKGFGSYVKKEVNPDGTEKIIELSLSQYQDIKVDI